MNQAISMSDAPPLRDGAHTDGTAGACAAPFESGSDSPGDGCAGTMAQHLCVIRSNEWVNDEYKHMVVSAPAAALAARPGQFFHLECPSGQRGTAYLRRPMSVYRIEPADGRIEFLYKVQGVGTQGLSEMVAGDTLNALGPLGHGFALPDACDHVLLLARGVGLATLAPLAGHAVAAGARVTAVLSARSRALVMSEAYLREVGAHAHIVLDDDRSSDLVPLEAKLRVLHGSNPFSFLATCGSNRMLALLQRLGAEWCVPGQVAIEQLMGCGIGACHACVRPFRAEGDVGRRSYRRVCWDGPVFDIQETLPW
ncbi:dihydroorotate dehydrogenase electron transfer subunit [Chitinasiproducens palmae]|uniref:Dihydroorotate dehydrogenase electron transfer subunit n=1 Tax=Chitinasiproducens palmae TaxID=1770053 RepID=A0A1H2PMJ1_9BURK|nr:dihydroorotate dehydrogenase electron transfer subunit [Chitinasiproducens palmae]SDV47288.1 dihydroorotate dehydrogenase electron transfer subunit [Chitinasiproducens palmae]